MKNMLSRILPLVTALALLPGALQAQTAALMEVRGTVLDDTKRPMVGVSVAIVGTLKGAMTDLDGRYTIKAEAKDVLSFSILGYGTVTEQVGGRTVIDVNMNPENQLLNETVVIGYGTARKSDLTGAVASLDMSKINDMSSLSIDKMLQGRVAGVDIVTSGGEPGAESSVRIRGTRSLSASNEPLIVVDGVMDAVSSLAEVDPSDIKNITVLKDASSTAIYGSRGANGVILITTDDPVSGKVSVDLSATVGVNRIAKKLDLMNAQEFAEYRNDVYTMDSNRFSTRGILPSTSWRYDNPLSVKSGTDWQDALTKTGFYQSYTLKVTGGTKDTKAYVLGRFGDQGGTVVGSGYRTFGFTGKLDQNIGKKVRLGVKFSFTQSERQNTNAKISGTSSTCAIALSPLLDISSTWNPLGDNGTTGGSVFNNPYLLATRIDDRTRKRRFGVDPYLEWKIVKGLKFLTRFSYTVNEDHGFYYSPSDLPVAAKRRTGGTAKQTSSSRYNLLSETTLTYERTFARKHKLGVMGGFTAQENRLESVTASGVGYLDDTTAYYNMAGLPDARNYSCSSKVTQVDRMSGLFRGTYSYASKYYLTLTGRADGSSNFAEGHKWAFFPAAALKWSLMKERFMSSSSSWLSDLSVRLGAGISGNDAVASYVSQMALTTSTSGWLFGETRGVAYYPTRLDNKDLTWEKTKSVNAGVDFSLFRNRLVFAVDGYVSRTSDLLLSVQNAAQSGYTSRWDNIGGTDNWGVEFSADVHAIEKRRFRWDIDLTVSHNTQTVTDIGSDYKYVATATQNGFMIYGLVPGYPANSLWGFKHAGVWHNTEEIAENEYTKAYAASYKTVGYSRYIDVNHDGLLNDEDLVYLGSADPYLNGGFKNSFTFWNSLTVGVYFTWSLGGYLYNFSEFNIGSGNTKTNQYRYMTGRFHPVRNPDSDIPAAYCNDSNPSDRYVHDASFLRLQNLSISYSFSKLLVASPFIKDIILGLEGQNVFLLSGYNGFDPEVNSSSGFMRLDNGAYPRSREFKFNVKLRF